MLTGELILVSELSTGMSEELWTCVVTVVVLVVNQVRVCGAVFCIIVSELARHCAGRTCLSLSNLPSNAGKVTEATNSAGQSADSSSINQGFVACESSQVGIAVRSLIPGDGQVVNRDRRRDSAESSGQADSSSARAENGRE